MAWETIRKNKAAVAATVRLADYDEACRSFRWRDARDGLPGGGLDIAYEALDRHVAKGKGGKTALRWIGRDLATRHYSSADLAAGTNRFANVLRGLGIGKGDRVYSLLGRVSELDIAALGTLKNGSVFSPLFSAFGPEPVKARASIREAAALVTTEAF